MIQAVDWRQLLFELRTSHGMTWRDIATETYLHRDSLWTYYNQVARPKHSDGEQIIALWMRITTKDRALLPMEDVPLSAAKLRSL